MLAWCLTLLLAQVGAPALENDYFKVMRNSAACASAHTASCGDRVIVALAPLTVESDRGRKRLERGGIAVFTAGESYRPPAGEFYEVALKTDHPPVQSPPVWIPMVHVIRNAGDRPLFNIVIELKPPRREAGPTGTSER